ncbi:hypothetical protein HYU50_01250, partial [Candidatus Woesearchaeota archaeon]|nr:hypothetical protein [Candidatus Woesearchaeota archaeon]
MPKTYIQKSRKIFNGKKGQANSNPGAFTRVAENENKKSSGNGTLIVVFAFVLFLFDIIIDYRGFNIVGLGQISGLFQFFKSLIFIVGIAAFFYFLTSRDKSPRAIASFIIAALIIIITLIFLFNLDPAPIYHFIFILVFWATFVRQREDAATANLILVAVLFFDLYFNSIINIFAPQVATWLEGIPFLFFLTLGYVYEQTNNKLAITFIGLILLWYLFTSGQAFASGLRAAAVEVVATELPNSPQEWLDMTLERLFTKPYDKVSKGVNAWISGQIQYAITGKVEKNQYEPLGVYLENVKSADAKYYENEDVVIWGTVRARTLDDPVNVKIGCYAKDGTQKIETKNVDPKATFPVFKLEEQDFACTFKNSDFKSILKSGSNTITTFA